MADDTNKGPLPGLGGAPATPARPADQKPVDAPKPADAPKADDKPAGGVNVVIERDYWPKDQPKPEDGASLPARTAAVLAMSSNSRMTRPWT
jgi:hypothetical protein